MKIQVASDLHLEINTCVSFEDILKPSAATLVLAGDIGNPSEKRYATFLEWCSENYETVILIAGNHEYYSFGKINWDMSKQKYTLGRICEDFPNIHFLDNRSMKLSDDVMVMGTTLWSYIPLKEENIVKSCINDFRAILKDKKAIRVDQYNKLHLECYRWLANEIKTHLDKTVIVVSHHLPSLEVIADKYKHCPYNSAFASTLDHLFKEPNVKYWFYGHSHASNDSEKDGCRLVANPYGYSKHENPRYRRDLVISI